MPNIDREEEAEMGVSSWIWLGLMVCSAVSVIALPFLPLIALALSSNAEPTEIQTSTDTSTNVIQAGEWLREVSTLPASPEREAFVGELGVAMSDGTISDEEHTNLSADYQVLTHKAE